MSNHDDEPNDQLLPPRQVTRLIAESAARQVVIEHIKLCPFAGSKIDERLRILETSFARLTGFMLGAGLLGGAAGAAVNKFLGP